MFLRVSGHALHVFTLSVVWVGSRFNPRFFPLRIPSRVDILPLYHKAEGRTTTIETRFVALGSNNRQSLRLIVVVDDKRPIPL